MQALSRCLEVNIIKTKGIIGIPEDDGLLSQMEGMKSWLIRPTTSAVLEGRQPLRYSLPALPERPRCRCVTPRAACARRRPSSPSISLSAHAQPRAQLDVGVRAHHRGERRRQVAQRAPVHARQRHGDPHGKPAQGRLVQREAPARLLRAELEQAQAQARLLSFLGRVERIGGDLRGHRQAGAVVLDRDG